MLIYVFTTLIGVALPFLFYFHFKIIFILYIFLIFILAIFKKWHYLKIIIFSFFIMSWTQYQIQTRLQFHIPSQFENTPIKIQGKILDIPIIKPASQDFTQWVFLKMKTNWICYKDQCLHQQIKIRLQGKIQYAPKSGEIWEGWVKLKNIHGTYNYGTFSKEMIAFRENIRASGKILSDSKWGFYKIQDASFWDWNAYRDHLFQKIQNLLPNSQTSHWLMALMLGERQGVLPQEWEILRKTGTNHLFAIAGLHIGFLAALIYWASRKLFNRIPFIYLIFPANIWAHLFSCCGVFFYGALSGFLIPTLRAFLMYWIYVMSLILRMNVSAWTIWSLSLILSLFIDPISILNESFWLSYSIVACLIFYFKNRFLYLENKKIKFFSELCLMQFVIAVGVSSLSLYFYSELSLIGVISNLIAVPWLEFFILPFVGLGMLCILVFPNFSKIVFQFSDFSLYYLWKTLEFFSQLSWASLNITLPISAIASVFFLSICLLLPKGLRFIFFPFTIIIAIILFLRDEPLSEFPKLKILDVGQGLSIIFETPHHTLVYDTGGAFKPYYDSGESIVSPILIQDRRFKIDKLVISHGDLDHRGGADYLIKQFPIQEIISSDQKHFPKARFCEAGQHWDWDGVHFSMIFPYKNAFLEGNNGSCVLKIQYQNQVILLTGDIEKIAQNQMMSNADELPSTILIAPHHGSKSSLQWQWMQKVHPLHVIFSTGYLNAFHLPSASVARAYQDLGATIWNTAKCGQIEFSSFDQSQLKIICHRKQYTRIWLDQKNF